MSKFKVQGVGLDTTNIVYKPVNDYFYFFDYVLTSVKANNEAQIKDYIKGASLITYIDFLDKSDDAILYHLEQLERDMVDLLLVDAKCDFSKYADTLSAMVDRGMVESIGIYGPASVDRIKEIQEVLPDLKYVGLDFCPLSFDADIMNYLREQEGVDILGFNPFGGKLSAQGVINSFSVPYLLSFSAYYSTIVFLSGRDIFTAAEERAYLLDLIDTEATEIYSLDKSVSKLYKPMKQVVGVSLKLDPNHTLPIPTDTDLYSYQDLELVLGKAKREINDLDYVVAGPEDQAYKYYRLFKPAEDDGTDESIIALIKPVIMTILKDENPDSEINLLKISSNIFVFNITKVEIGGWLRKKVKKTEYKNYLLSVSNKELEFCEIEMARSASDKTLES